MTHDQYDTYNSQLKPYGLKLEDKAVLEKRLKNAHACVIMMMEKYGIKPKRRKNNVNSRYTHDDT